MWYDDLLYNEEIILFVLILLSLQEFELIKKAREEMNDDKIYDFTNIRAEERRKEALMELETVKSLRQNFAFFFIQIYDFVACGNFIYIDV